MLSWSLSDDFFIRHTLLAVLSWGISLFGSCASLLSSTCMQLCVMHFAMSARNPWIGSSKCCTASMGSFCMIRMLLMIFRIVALRPWSWNQLSDVFACWGEKVMLAWIPLRLFLQIWSAVMLSCAAWLESCPLLVLLASAGHPRSVPVLAFPCRGQIQSLENSPW